MRTNRGQWTLRILFGGILLTAGAATAALVEGTNCGFVTVAPTEDPQGSAGQLDAYATASRFTSPAGAVVVTEIGWWCDNATEAANWEAGIYTNSGTAPATLLDGVSRTNAKGTDGGWKRATGLSIIVSPNTVYWLAVQLDNTATTTNYNREVDAAYARESKARSSLAQPWDPGTAGSYLGGIYAVYESQSVTSIPILLYHYRSTHNAN